ncbi:MAG TPA: DMT family transporter [Lachnospiraceae bacterium]|nr:DMT family transporter [Lachnospiraceae bacterium]
MRKRWGAYMDLSLAMFISGSAIVVSKLMVGTMPPFLLTEIGIFIGLLILYPVTFIYRKEFYKLDLRTFLALLGQAVCGIVLYRIFTLIGLSYTSAANSGLITSSTPAMVEILAAILLKEKVSWNGLIGLLLVLAGLFTINIYTYSIEGTGKTSLFGNFLILVAVVCEALFSVLSKMRSQAISPLFRTTMIATIAFACLLPFALCELSSYKLGSIPARTGYCLVYYGVCVSFLSHVLWFKGIGKVKASEAATFTSVVPISSIILAAILLRERIAFVHLIGMILIIGGILFSAVQPAKRISNES